MNYPILLAIFDFIPGFLFLIGIFYISKYLSASKRKIASYFLGGGLIVFLGALAKASWKLSQALAGPDISLLDNLLFPFSSLGFLIMLIALILFLRPERKLSSYLALAPWKIPLVAISSIANLAVLIILIRNSFKIGLNNSAMFFIGSMISMLVMIWLSQTSLDIPLQWTAEAVNSVGQACFALGGYYLFKSI